jgi:ATP-binding cassette subfamily C (CFTR/MRP) protein 1
MKESEAKVDKNLSMLYLINVSDCWLGVRLETIGAFIVMFACLFAILARETIGEAMVGLSISYAIQIAAVLSYFVMIATEVMTLLKDIVHQYLIFH